MFKKIMLTICLLCCSVMLLPSMESKAETIEQFSYPDFIVNYPEPTCGEYQGYINLLLRTKGADGTFGTSDDEQSIRTFFWYTYGMSGTAKVPVSAYITIDGSANTFSFTLAGNTSVSTSAYYCLSQIDDVGNYHCSTGTSTAFTYNFGQWGLDIAGIRYKGNVGKVTTTGGSPSSPFTVTYSNDASSKLLHNIYETLMSIEDIDDKILFRVNEIWKDTTDIEIILSDMHELLNLYLQAINDSGVSCYWELYNLNQQIPELLEEQKKSNTWLEKIFDLIKGNDEKQKQEAQIAGDSSIDSGKDAIEDKGAAFGASIGDLVSTSMSYSGTECAWKFPSIKLPAIPGIMDEVVLCKEQTIDFAYWVNKLPSSVLLLVQSLGTMALIVYCFKELYGTVSYVLTLRRSSE